MLKTNQVLAERWKNTYTSDQHVMKICMGIWENAHGEW